MRQLPLTGPRQLEWLDVDEHSLERGVGLGEPFAVTARDLDSMLVTARVVPWDDAAEALVEERRKLVFAGDAA